MEHSRKADDCSCLLNSLPHDILSLIYVSYDFRDRAVVPDGAGKNDRNVVLYAAVDYSVIYIVVFDELRDRTAPADLVVDIEVVVVAVRLGLLCIDVLTESRVEQR